MSPRKPQRKHRRRLVSTDVHGESLKLARGVGQAYFLLPDPQRGGAKVRHYQGRYFAPGSDDGEVHGPTLERAQRFIAEWRAAKTAVSSRQRDATMTVARVLDAFTAERKAWASASELLAFESATAPLRELYGRDPVTEFGPLKLKAVREQMIEGGDLSRVTVNSYVRRLRMIFRWGVENELVPPSIAQALDCVAGIRIGREPRLREARKVEPVSEDNMRAVLPLVSRQVAAMIELCWWSGMRPGEAVQMRTGDIDRSDSDVWTYTPRKHKTAWRGRERPIMLGPNAQAILRAWLRADPEAFLFQPREAEEARLAAREAARTTPEGQGNVRGSNRAAEPQRSAGEAYTTDSFRRAVTRACDDAGIEPWAPNRLRHAAGTRLRKALDLEAARTVLGHASSSITTVYAELDQERAREAMKLLG